MKTTLSLLAFILLLSLAGNYIQWISAKQQSNYRDQDNDRFQVEQKRKLTQIASRDAQIQALLNERTSDSAKYASEQSRLKSRISALKSKVSGPAVIQDTIIVFQDSLISSISSERDTLYITDNTVIDSLETSVNQFSELFKEQWIRTDKAEWDLRREKKKRFSVGIQTGAGFKGMDIQVGIQYSLFRF